jgi:hypothetical protein
MRIEAFLGCRDVVTVGLKREDDEVTFGISLGGHGLRRRTDAYGRAGDWSTTFGVGNDSGNAAAGSG